MSIRPPERARSYHPYRALLTNLPVATTKERSEIDGSLLFTGAFLCVWSCARIAWGWIALLRFDAEEAFAVIVFVSTASVLFRMALRFRKERGC